MKRLVTLLAVLVAFVGIGLGQAPQAHAAPAAWPVVKAGAAGAQVTTIQHLLTPAGQSVAASGSFDAATVAKVKAFQSAKGLTADGVVGPATWRALVAGTASTSGGGSGDVVPPVVPDGLRALPRRRPRLAARPPRPRRPGPRTDPAREPLKTSWTSTTPRLPPGRRGVARLSPLRARSGSCRW